MIDLTKLPHPAVVQEIDYEVLLQQRKDRLLSAVPADTRTAIANTLALESEPLTLLLQENTYREMILRQRINDAARSTFLAYATGTDLDNRAADYGVSRLLIQSADPDANPPTEAIFEDDERLRYRCQMALEGLSVAGSRGAYIYHALTASAHVADVQIDSPVPGTVRVWILDTRGGAGTELCNRVRDALNAETIRPLCDTVTVESARPVSFSIIAKIDWYEGAEIVSGGVDAARVRVEQMLSSRRVIGATVPRSAVDAAIHVEGVNRVTIVSPGVDIECGTGEYPACTGITLS